MHQHNHAHQAAGSRLILGIGLSSVILIAEAVGGLISNSLALLSDAGHVLADIVALSLSAYALRQAQRPPSHRMTFGYHRIGVIVAIVNAVAIFAIAGIIFFEAVRRLQSPPDVDSSVMLVIALLGLLANLIVAFWLREARKESLNVKSAFWHVLGDALASVGVILGALIIKLTGLAEADAIISIVIGLIIAASAWGILSEGISVLLESTPAHIDLNELAGNLRNIPGIKEVHDLHVWSLTPNLHALSSHIVIEDRLTSETALVRSQVEKLLADRYEINHTTLQLECQSCCPGGQLCTLEPGSCPLTPDGEH
ncbi:cobalt-zinc-cadmium efflux system protein [Dehalogenimonas formicexedens]|uniref:Cobalt-zinc-cadmium efflux system protein n=1 Tax=Dehalogenimonas formicexedens TaxID=1839801 RepID=A0A1P8F512_9CHLR|nr:cation diffusion facilitator family transporter [Dehalogenimonas formicexedens]APV43442.1 cobalt-zinc-cadmium efflux system protein [Dehalogenimonas formicexedens]